MWPSTHLTRIVDDETDGDAGGDSDEEEYYGFGGGDEKTTGCFTASAKGVGAQRGTCGEGNGEGGGRRSAAVVELVLDQNMRQKENQQLVDGQTRRHQEPDVR